MGETKIFAFFQLLRKICEEVYEILIYLINTLLWTWHISRIQETIQKM